MKKDLTIKCAWCGKIIHQGQDKKVTHGMCPDCVKKMYDKMKIVAIRLGVLEKEDKK